MIRRILASVGIAALLGIGTAHAAYLPGPYSVASGGTGLTSGTSGGVPYFNSTSTMASSALLTTNVLVKGGGAGAAPAPSSITDNGTTITSTEGLSVGALTASGTITFSGLTSAGCVTNTSGGVLGTAGCGTAWTVTPYTSNTTPLTLASTNYLQETINQITPAALVIDLPASPSSPLFQCVNDEGQGFATHAVTVKTTDSATILKASGSTGYAVPLQNGLDVCFLYSVSDTNWIVK